MEFKQETHPGKVQKTKIVFDKHYHPASIGDIDLEVLKEQCKYRYNYKTHQYEEWK